MDEALSLPTEQAVQVALRTQQIIAYETGVCDTVDPMAGSYAIEHLTAQIESRAADYIQRIDDLGGALKAIEAGFINMEIQDAAYRYQRAVESGEQVIVGVNQFTVQAEEHRDLLRVNPEIEAGQRRKLAELRARRDNVKVAELRSQLEKAARGRDNLLPLFVTCVENDLTLGEICHTLRGVFGEYHPTVSI
jgi:methylmalonyl-CoA mutase N-terminal domain/subunit